jgi:hypothetical protein
MSESEQKPELRKSLTERDNRIKDLERENYLFKNSLTSGYQPTNTVDTNNPPKQS